MRSDMRPSANATPKRSLLQTTLHILGWMCATFMLVVALAAVWAWSNRYELIERQAITYLNSIGIEADLKIQSATGTKADIRNIQLSYDNKPFLNVNRLQAAYQWRDLLKGDVDRLDFSGLDATIIIGEDGQIVDGWLPPPTANGQGEFPKRGIGVSDAKLTLVTPYGTLPISGQFEARSATLFQLDGRLEQTRLAHDGVTVDLEGPLTLDHVNGVYDIAIPGIALSASHPAGQISRTRLNASGRYVSEDQSFRGQASLSGGAFTAESGVAGSVTRVDTDGSWNDGTLNATLETDIRQARVTDLQRRNELAERLSLYKSLVALPVAENFVPQLLPPLNDLLGGSNIQTRMDVTVTKTIRQISLLTPLTFKASKTTATLSPVPNRPLYYYKAGDDAYTLSTSLKLSRPLAINLDPVTVQIRSFDGLRLDAIASASGRLNTDDPWISRTQTGRPAQMSRLSVQFDYAAPLNEPSVLSMTGRVQYDGDVPGGYVDNLRLRGNLTAQTADRQTRVDFSPTAAVQVDRLETSSDWIIENFSGQLDPASPLYARNASQVATIRTGLKSAEFTATRPESETVEAASLDMRVEQALMWGTVRDREQNWDVEFSDLSVQSKTFPVPDTNLVIPEGQLRVKLADTRSTRFQLNAPDSRLQTPLFLSQNMVISVVGTTDSYQLDYADGRIKFTPQSDGLEPLSFMPVSGTLRFAETQFSGQAQTFLPRAPDNPIDVIYRLKDGRGEADISIERLNFRPRGLQPQDLAPALRGKIAQVNGTVNANLLLQFGTDVPLTGTGTLDILNTSLGTAPGPVTGLSGTLELTSLFPVTTAPDQVLNIGSFNPGFELEDGELTYRLVPDGVDIARAVFPISQGQVSFDPFLWTYGAPENRVTLRVSDVEIGEFLNNTPDSRLSITGILEGTVPVVVRGIDVLVEQGRLEVKGGGTIRIEGGDVADRIPNEYAGKAIQALRDFNYDSLFLDINGPLDGNVVLGLAFTGSNPDILYNVPFQFDVTVEGELFNIARSLNPNGMQERILATVKNNASQSGN